MTPGQIVYRLYHQPVGYLTRTLRTGIRKTIATNRGRREMMAAALRLREVIYPGAETATVYFLTGKKYWYQTAFCLYSLQQQAGCNVHAVLVDDGSFDEELAEQVRKQFPSTITVVYTLEIDRLLDERLPASNFPVLRARRLEYPHLRKLTDVHILDSSGSKLVLDSDMLFFRRPDAMLQWMEGSPSFLFMRDATESYGYSRDLMKELSGGVEVPSRVNVGVAGLQSDRIDWKELERWTDELLKREGSSYLQEQALTAMLATKRRSVFLDENEYKVFPRINGAAVPEILHHYVAESKYDYFVQGWKMVRVR